MLVEKFITKQNKIAYQWKFENSYLQLLFDANDKTNSDLFQQLICKLIYQTGNRKVADEQIDQKQLDQYCRILNDQKTKKKKKNRNQLINDDNSDDDSDDGQNYGDDYIKVQELMTELIQQEDVKMAYTGRLYRIVQKRQLMNRNVVYMIVETKEYQYSQKIVDADNKAIVETQINYAMDFNIDYLKNGIKFMDYAEQQFKGYMVVFDKEVINDVKIQLLKYRFEQQEQDDLETILTRYGDDQVQVEQQLMQTNQQGCIEIEQECIDEMDEYDDFEVCNVSTTQYEQQKQIKQILYNQNSNKTFVNDENVIKVYDNKDDQFEMVGQLSRLKIDEQNVDSKNMLLFSDNQKFIITDNNQNECFYEYDINREQITSQINIDQGIQIDQLTYSQKNQNQTANQVLYGINNKNIYQMDLRMTNKKTLVNSKNYKTDPKLNSICAAMNGRFAVGSDDGIVRLYKGLGDNSLNNFYTLSRNKITMIDCTKDGKYMIVTTDKELFLFDCTSQNKNGFENRLQSSKGERQPPIVLKLLVNDIQKYQIANIQFKKARFDESNQNEKYIVASVNQFIVTWSISNVVNGQTQKYKIYRAEDDQMVVDSMFKSGDQKTQLFATKSIVSMKRLNRVKSRIVDN